MTSRLGERLNAARHRQFVGRAAELTLFQSTLTAVEVPFYVLYIFGPGGVGKTSLLQEFDYICRRTQIPAISIDGRNIEPGPDAFMAALSGALDLPEKTAPLEFLAGQPSRYVLLIDTYEMLASLDQWLRRVSA